MLRRLFIPRLARIDRESKAPQRRVARQSELPADLLGLARALTQRRLLVVKLAGARPDGSRRRSTATLEVAHEALLRRWPTLADLLAEDRDALLLLDGVLLAAADWDKAEPARKGGLSRPSRLAPAGCAGADARGPDWAREIAPARAYLAACQAHARTRSVRKKRPRSRAKQARLAEIAEAQQEIKAGAGTHGTYAVPGKMDARSDVGGGCYRHWAGGVAVSEQPRLAGLA